MAERRHGEPAPKTVETIAGADWYGDELATGDAFKARCLPISI